MSINFDINERIRKLVMQQRNRAVMCNRLKCGLLMFLHQPQTLVFPLLLVALTAFICCNLDRIPLPDNTIPEVAALWEIAVAFLIVILAVLLLFGLLIMLGTPPKAKCIDAGLVHIGLVDRYGIGPALVSSQKISGSMVRVLTFYSKGIAKERWEQKQRDIEDVLNFRSIEPVQYGKNSNYIVLTVAPGVRATRNEPLYDDEL